VYGWTGAKRFRGYLRGGVMCKRDDRFMRRASLRASCTASVPVVGKRR
jgi:hypothetical protein